MPKFMGIKQSQPKSLRELILQGWVRLSEASARNLLAKQKPYGKRKSVCTEHTKQ